MNATAVLVIAMAGCSGGGGGASDRDGGALVDGEAPGGDPDAPGGGGGARRVLYQCTPFDGGLCAMDADGGDPETLDDAGFAPRGAGGGAVLSHTAAYRVARRDAGGRVDDLGDGAFPTPHPDGRIVFQCHGLGGGLCVMDADGGDRDELRASGRVPDVAPDGRIAFHTDGYHVVVRAPSGDEDDLGEGAFPRWTDDGRLVFQCAGLGGGLCAMDADGSDRETLRATGRVPDPAADGAIVFHDDDYVVSVRDDDGQVTALRGGANAAWW